APKLKARVIVGIVSNGCILHGGLLSGGNRVFAHIDGGGAKKTGVFPNTLAAAELGYIEQWGSGLQRIKTSCLNLGLEEPQIREQGDFVDVVFYRPEAESSDKVSDKYRIVSDSIG